MSVFNKTGAIVGLLIATALAGLYWGGRTVKHAHGRIAEGEAVEEAGDQRDYAAMKRRRTEVHLKKLAEQAERDRRKKEHDESDFECYMVEQSERADHTYPMPWDTWYIWGKRTKHYTDWTTVDYKAVNFKTKQEAFDFLRLWKMKECVPW